MSSAPLAATCTQRAIQTETLLSRAGHHNQVTDDRGS